MKVLSVFKYVFSLVGVVLLIGGAIAYKSSEEFLLEAVSTPGTVVALVKSRSSDSITYQPVVEFVGNDGKSFDFTSSSGSNPPSYSVGEKVEVLYPPANPQDAKINSFFDLWGGAVVMAVMGGIFFLIGGLIFLIGKLKNRKKEYLQRKGTRVEAEFQAVECNRNVSINGRNPFLIVCHWLNPATSEVHKKAKKSECWSKGVIPKNIMSIFHFFPGWRNKNER
ncbi:hypothetical protein D9M71_167980 [compost metagenome]